MKNKKQKYVFRPPSHAKNHPQVIPVQQILGCIYIFKTI